ncbi:Putative 3-dehydroquinate dehydratase type I, aldolase-type TIM barrel [Septoria linicola]|uniref:3-dehydroquinate dehydratase type I, aldolase-type TIM barrel n=1 Tax=Septoria linicola TaxID=215465 RepID=A0A9Q9B073_9PEZI|nr:putative 3-dehydroquinate dehydratase type I, aldolase-type TIM barrel [Septoria linicola]USW58295.1 Putative 3-dehydroquinate dehydratase type I, aldolase-type TIM barrel [Septoria linicola]
MAVGPMPAAMTKVNGVMKIEDIIHNEPPRLLVIFDKGQEEITRVVADVLGYTYRLVDRLEGARGWSGEVVVGLENGFITAPESLRNLDRTLITTHCVDAQDARYEYLTDYCDYEYLYTKTAPIRRDVARFLAFVLGQTKPHEDLKKKPRTTMLSTTFPDIRAALPNLDILSVGADSVELRVDLLRDPANENEFGAVPSLKYVGEQVMLLRQRTELPIVFTTRCTKENGRFPMDDPELYYEYLRKAIQWGCEYIDVELWLPVEIRRRLAAEKGHSKIISAWHDFSGRFKWTSPEAQKIFQDSSLHSDIVKMIALVNTMEDNYELEYFRSTVQGHSYPQFSALNMGVAGQLSRTLNKVFTPITHPLMPLIAAPGQLSAAEINSMLHSMGQMPELDIHAIGRVRDNGHAMFLEKCLNELSLPHRLLCVEQPPTLSIQPYLARPQFGGAYINPPLPVESATYLPTLTEAASAIGQVDTVAVRRTNSGHALIADNVTWKGIRATLTRDFIPSAYCGRTSIVIANSEAQAAAAIYALTSLDIGSVYTIGFQAPGHKQLQGLGDLDMVEEPFAVISALPAERSMAAVPVLKHYTTKPRKISVRSGRIFVDLSNGIKGNGDSVSVAESLGWAAYPCADYIAWTIVEAIRGLVGENVPCDFVRLAAGRGLYT